MVVAPGRKFGRYTVEALVASGGMGRIWRAHDDVGRTVALKVLVPKAEGNAELIARLVREARLAASLAHPNVVVVHEVGEIEGVVYIAMEWLAGRPLASDLATNASLAERFTILADIAEALAHAHGRGVIHRDVKPSNVIVSPEGRAKLVDFGIARPTAAQATVVTQDALILGTPRYMAPEQRLTSDVDAQADQFAWGVVAYELLACMHPEEGMTEGTFPHGRAVPLAWRCEGLSEETAAVIHRAMALQPEARFASMHALLVAWRASHATAPPPKKEKPARTSERGAGIGRIFVMAMGACLAVGLVAAIAFWFSLSRSSPSSLSRSSSDAAPNGSEASSFGGSATVAPPEGSSRNSLSTSSASSISLSSSAEPPAELDAGALDVEDAASPAKPHVPRIAVNLGWFAKPAEARARLHQAMPALIACFAGKHVTHGAIAEVHLKTMPDGTVTESWSQEICRGARCGGARTWLPEGGAKCALKAFEPLTTLSPLIPGYDSSWINIDVYP